MRRRTARCTARLSTEKSSGYFRETTYNYSFSLVYRVSGSITLTRNSLAMTSLVAALPAGFMTYLGVMAFLNSTENMPTMLKVVLGLTLFISVLIVLSPVLILLFVKSVVKDENEESEGAAPAPAESEVDLAVSDLASEEEIPVADDEFGDVDDEDFGGSGSFEDDEFDDGTEEDLGDDAFEFDDDEFAFDDDEFK